MKVKCDIWRCGKDTGQNGRYDSYVLNVDPTETVLGILVKINHDFDAGLSFRYSCGVIKCGECAVEVNGSPCLACEKVVEKELKIRPLSGLPIIKDLVIDRRAVLDKIWKISPSLAQIRGESTTQHLDQAGLDIFVRLTKCFECLMCQSVCPIRADREDKFVGPLGMVWLAQMSLDSRNKSYLDTDIESALEACMRCGLCSDACKCSEDIIGLAIEMLEKT